MQSIVRAVLCATALLSLSLAGCGGRLRLIERPISFSQERVRLSAEYIEHHYGITASDITIAPRIIVVHYTAIPNLASSFATFERETLPESRPELRSAGEVNVSCHFLVDRKGAIYRLMPETRMARHCIGLNFDSIGIENVGGAAGADDLTEDQLRANVRLVRHLVAKYPAIQYLIGHHEYLEFEGHPLWKERDPTYRTTKSDPGERFMQRLRTALRDLKLKGVQEIRAERESH